VLLLCVAGENRSRSRSHSSRSRSKSPVHRSSKKRNHLPFAEGWKNHDLKKQVKKSDFLFDLNQIFYLNQIKSDFSLHIISKNVQLIFAVQAHKT